MSKTACWAYNDDTDCAAVFLGYGSRWEPCGHVTDAGYQLSKRGLKTLLKYDYEWGLPFDIITDKELVKYKVPFKPKQYDCYEDCYDLTNEEIERLPINAKCGLGWLYIHHPKSQEWFEECVPYSGQYIRESGNKAPHLEEIKSICEEDYRALKRLFEMNDNACNIYKPFKKFESGIASLEDLMYI